METKVVLTRKTGTEELKHTFNKYMLYDEVDGCWICNDSDYNYMKVTIDDVKSSTITIETSTSSYSDYIYSVSSITVSDEPKITIISMFNGFIEDLVNITPKGIIF